MGTYAASLKHLRALQNNILRMGVVLDNERTENTVVHDVQTLKTDTQALQRRPRWYSGSGAPPAMTGTAGDFYLDTSELTLYNKSTVWMMVANLRGATGPTGPTGLRGPTGATGATSQASQEPQEPQDLQGLLHWGACRDRRASGASGSCRARRASGQGLHAGRRIHINHVSRHSPGLRTRTNANTISNQSEIRRARLLDDHRAWPSAARGGETTTGHGRITLQLHGGAIILRRYLRRQATDYTFSAAGLHTFSVAETETLDIKVKSDSSTKRLLVTQVYVRSGSRNNTGRGHAVHEARPSFVSSRATRSASMPQASSLSFLTS